MTSSKTLPIPPKAVIFDWDLTLANTFGALVDAYHATSDAFGIRRWSEDEIRKFTAYSLRDNFPHLFGEDKWKEARDVFYTRFAAEHFKHISIIPGVTDLLDCLKDNIGCPMGVVSNKNPKYLIQEVEYLGLMNYMDVIVGAGEAARDKPHPDPIWLASERLGIIADKNVWYVGDWLPDVKSANAAGCTSIIIGHKDSEVLAESPDFYFDNIADFIDNISFLLLKNNTLNNGNSTSHLKGTSP